jgi:hypothetical protein
LSSAAPAKLLYSLFHSFKFSGGDALGATLEAVPFTKGKAAPTEPDVTSKESLGISTSTEPNATPVAKVTKPTFTDIASEVEGVSLDEGLAPTPFSPIDTNKVVKDDDARVPIELWGDWI